MQVRAAYRRLALSLHPDKCATADGEAREAAELRFKRVNLAHDILTDTCATRCCCCGPRWLAWPAVVVVYTWHATTSVRVVVVAHGRHVWRRYKKWQLDNGASVADVAAQERAMTEMAPSPAASHHSLYHLRMTAGARGG